MEKNLNSTRYRSRRVNLTQGFWSGKARPTWLGWSNLAFNDENKLASNENEPSMTEYDTANRTITKATEQNRKSPGLFEQKKDELDRIMSLHDRPKK